MFESWQVRQGSQIARKTRLLINLWRIWRVAISISCPNFNHILQGLGQNHIYHAFHGISDEISTFILIQRHTLYQLHICKSTSEFLEKRRQLKP